MSARRKLTEKGRLMASFLAGSWRQEPPPLGLSLADTRRLVPLLIDGGAGSLAYHRLRRLIGEEASGLEPLSARYRLDTLHRALYERQLIRLVARLQSSGVDPLLAKGLVIAKDYPETTLRACREIDLWIRPKEYAAAVDILQGVRWARFPAYLHQRSRRLDASWEELYGRSRFLGLGEAKVRTVGPEDHLCLLCLHTLYHGAWNPIWMCDIAAAVESLPTDFDWDYCTRARSNRYDRVAVCLGLASELLGASLEGVPQRLKGGRPPAWLTASVLKHWGGRKYHQENPSMISCLREPDRTTEVLSQLWPNPIHATIRLGRPLNSLPRFPFQALDGAYRAIRFLLCFPEAVCRNP